MICPKFEILGTPPPRNGSPSKRFASEDLGVTSAVAEVPKSWVPKKFTMGTVMICSKFEIWSATRIL